MPERQRNAPPLGRRADFQAHGFVLIQKLGYSVHGLIRLDSRSPAYPGHDAVVRNTETIKVPPCERSAAPSRLYGYAHRRRIGPVAGWPVHASVGDRRAQANCGFRHHRTDANQLNRFLAWYCAEHISRITRELWQAQQRALLPA